MRWFVGIIVLLVGACAPNQVIEQADSLPNAMWAYQDTIWVEASIEDTATAYDLYLAIRHNQDYPYSNLWVHVQTFYPSGATGLLKEQLFIGNNEEQRWNTECMHDICNGLLPIVQGVRFSEMGDLRFAITHIMRTNPLPGVMDVGLRIERQP